MRERASPFLRGGFITALTVLCSLSASNSACAQAVGRLRLRVLNAANNKPLSRATVTIKDGTRPDITITTDAQGSVTSPQLNIGTWDVLTDAPLFAPDARQARVTANQTTDIEILLAPLQEQRVTIRLIREARPKNQVANVETKSQNDITKITGASGNQQSLTSVLVTNPGIVQDSVNQTHARGEHGETGLVLNGFFLPDALQGRATQVIVPETIQSLDILTGSFAPEYGGATAAILDITMRAGTTTPLHHYDLDGGEFSTYDGALALGGQFGRTLGKPDSAGRSTQQFGYFIDLNARRTQNALEAPQPDDQTAHNTGAFLSAFGNFSYTPGSKDQLTLTVNSTPGYTQIANRTGLPSRYANIGQGYGFAGMQNAGTTTTLPDGTAVPLISQDAAGQDINQRDSNEFGILNWKHTFNSHFNGFLAFGMSHSGQEIRNNNPAVNLANLPVDSSIEYNPTIIRNYRNAQTQGSLTYNQPHHVFKAGFLLDDQEGDEAYQLIPASQTALSALAAVDAGGVLTPAGLLDSTGNYIQPAAGSATPTTPTLLVHRSGFYRAAYAQDTWNVSKRIILNYGLRLDWYKQGQNLGQGLVNQAQVSPRINLSYSASARTTIRASYNRLFEQPPLAQGAIVGQSILPETLSQYDVSVERRIAPGQSVKLAYYYKDIRDQVDTGLLIPGTQIGAYASVNFTQGAVHGIEFSYDLTPRHNTGLGGYLSLAQTVAKPNGVDNLGNPVPDFNDHDQLNTISAGTSYTFRSGASVDFDLYHGSGTASSIVDVNGQRTTRTNLDLAFSTGPRLFGGNAKDGKGGLTLSISNLLDDRSVINFNSGFSGTRFQQGRRILLTVSGNF